MIFLNPVSRSYCLWGLTLIAFALSVLSCKKDDTTTTATPAAVTVTSVKSGMKELTGSSNADDVSLTANFVVTFSKAINPASANDFTLTPSGGTAILLTVTNNGTSVTIDPSVDLSRATNYVLTIAGSIKATDGGAYTSQSILFHTENPLIPGVTIASIMSDGQELTGAAPANNVSLSANLVITFSKEINAASASSFTLTPNGGSAVPLTITQSGATVSVNPGSDLLPGTTYTLAVDTNIKGIDGGKFPGQYLVFNSYLPVKILSLKSGAADLLTGPVSQKASASADLVITFNKALNAVSTAQFKITKAGVSVPVTVTQAGTEVTLNPATNLLGATSYILEVDTLRATDGTKFEGQNIPFTTASAVSVTSVLSGTQELVGSGVVNVSPLSDLVITFSKAINPATVGDFTLTPSGGSAIPFTLTNGGTTVTLNPNSDLQLNKLYTLTMDNNLSATDGGPFAGLTLTFTTSTSAIIIPQPGHQLAYFPFDNSVNSSIGTWSVTNVSSSFATGRKGLPNSAVSFNGTTDIIEVANGAALFTPSSTLSFWIMTDTTSGHGLFAMGINGFRGSHVELDGKANWFKNGAGFTNAAGDQLNEDFFFNGDGKYKDNGGWQGHNFNTDLSASGGVRAALAMKWAHLVFTYEASTRLRTMYLNGTKMMQSDFNLWPAGDIKQGVTGQKAFTTPTPECSTVFAFGFIKDRSAQLWATEPWGNYNLPTANHFKGMLDDVRFFDLALTPSEVNSLYNAEKP